MEKGFRYSFCLAFSAHIVEKEETSKDDVLRELESFPWMEELRKIDEADDMMYQFPSFEIENAVTGHSINISIAGDPQDHDFTIFYNRPGMITAHDIGVYETDVKTMDEVMEIANAFVNNDLKVMNDKFNAH